MLSHNQQPEESADNVKVTPEELAKAIANLEAKRVAEQGKIAIGDAIEQLDLEATPEEILAEISAIRATGPVKSEADYAPNGYATRTETLEAGAKQARSQSSQRRVASEAREISDYSPLLSAVLCVALIVVFAIGAFMKVDSDRRSSLRRTAPYVSRIPTAPNGKNFVHGNDIKSLNEISDGEIVLADLTSFQAMNSGVPHSSLSTMGSRWHTYLERNVQEFRSGGSGSLWRTVKKSGGFYLRGIHVQPAVDSAGRRYNFLNFKYGPKIDGRQLDLAPEQVGNLLGIEDRATFGLNEGIYVPSLETNSSNKQE